MLVQPVKTTTREPNAGLRTFRVRTLWQSTRTGLPGGAILQFAT